MSNPFRHHFLYPTVTRQFVHRLILLVFLVLSLVIALNQLDQIKNYLSRAEYQPANIRINLKVSSGKLNKSWQAFTQGGESDQPMLSPVSDSISALQPQYIRLDHIFDFYVDIDTSSQPYQYDFTRLDRVIREVTATGATPFISLSYTPPSLTSGSVVSPPDSYGDWQNLVTATVEHLSGRQGFNLTGVYYEVWNEPDLFGGYKPGRYPDYLKLYQQTALAAGQAADTNQYYIGGPATTDYYPNWIDKLITYTRDRDLPLDFISFHLYNLDDTIFQRRLTKLKNQLQSYPGYVNLPILITEWGSDSENSPRHDSAFDAIHSLAVISRISQQLDWLFSFELVDGLSDTAIGQSQAYWGRWGLLTHPKYGGVPKPRYYAFPFLNQLDGQVLAHTGNGTFVTALATQKNTTTTQILLVNFDTQGQHQEQTPLTLLNLPAGEYRLTEDWFNKPDPITRSFTTTGQSYQDQILLPPQSAVILTIQLIGQLGQFTPGHTGQAMLAAEPLPAVSWPTDELNGGGSIDFWTRPTWPATSAETHEWLSGPLAGGAAWRILTQRSQFGHRFYCGRFLDSQPEFTVSADISSWTADSWHRVTCRFITKLGLTHLQLYLNGALVDEASQLGQLEFVGPMSLSASDTFIDELTVAKQVSPPPDAKEETIFYRSFNGSSSL